MTVNKSLNVHIGPLNLGFTARKIPDIFYKKLAPFVAGKKAGFTIPVEFKKREVKTDGRVLLDGGSRIITMRREDFVSTIDTKLNTGKAVIADDYLSFNSYLRVVSSIALIRHNAVMLHASGLVAGGRAHIFIGKSGAGKSTVIKNSPSLQGMGDEMIGIVKKGKTYYAFSTPFGGELGTPAVNISKPVERFYVIKKSKKFGIKKMPVSKALPVMLRCTVNFHKDADVVADITNMVIRVLQHVPVFELNLKIDSSFSEIYNTQIKYN